MPEKEFVVSSLSNSTERLDINLAVRIKSLSRAQIQSLIDKGKVTVNGRIKKSSYKLKKGDKIWIDYQIPKAMQIEPQNIPLHILYQDDYIIVLDKPSGIVVHPGAGNRKNTLVNALLYHLPQIREIGTEERPGIVHRLDKETSGVLIVAKNLKAYQSLKKQFKKREVDKVYVGLIKGKMPQKEGEISHPIGRHVKDRKRMSIRTRKPRVAITYYSVLKELIQFTLLKIKPLTGRTHQIRVHFSALGHPIVGDKHYGGGKLEVNPPRMFLHAQELIVIHPATREKVSFFSPLPADLSNFLKKIQQDKKETIT